MNDALRNTIIVSLILATAIGVSFLSQRAQDLELDRHMALLGEKFLALVDDGDEKSQLAGQYQEFLEKVENREVEPEEVERAAAAILNVTTSHQHLTPEQAAAVMQVAIDAPDVLAVAPGAPAAIAIAEVHDDEWQTLDLKLKNVYQLSQVFDEAEASFDTLRPMTFDFNTTEGIKVVVSADMEDMFSETDYEVFATELKELEEMEMVEWKQDLAEELRKEHHALQIELHTLRKELMGLKDEKQRVQVMHMVETVSRLDSLGVVPIVDLDSILISVGKTLESIDVVIE